MLPITSQLCAHSFVRRLNRQNSSLVPPLILRLCTALRKASEEERPPLSISLSNKRFQENLTISFEQKEKYSLVFRKCVFDRQALSTLIEGIRNFNILELTLSDNILPNRTISSLLENCCLANLVFLNLSGLPLKTHHFKLLERLLPHSQIRSLTLSSEKEEDLSSFKNSCAQLGIDLQITQSNKERITKVNHVSTDQQKMTFLSPLNKDSIVQGGFDSYELITTTKRFLEISPLLSNGFFVSLIRNSEHFNEIDLHSLILGIANGRGFIIPYKMPLTNRASLSVLHQKVKELLQNHKIPKFFYTYRNDYLTLKDQGIFVQGLGFDVKLALRMVSKNLSLYKYVKKFNAQSYFVEDPFRNPRESRLVSSTKKIAARDYQLFLSLEETLKKRGKYTFFHRLLLPAEELFLLLRAQGVAIDQPFIQSIFKDSQKSLDIAEQNLEFYRQHLLQIKNAQNKSIMSKITAFFRSLFQNTSLLQEPKVCENIEEEVLLREIAKRKNTNQLLKETSDRISSNRLFFHHRRPDFFQGIAAIPRLGNLSSKTFPYLFLSKHNKSVGLIEFGDLFLRILAQLSQDTKLKNLCIKYLQKEDLATGINRLTFKTKQFIHHTNAINLFVSGRISKKRLASLLNNDTDRSLIRYFTIFKQLECFLSLSSPHKTEQTHFKKQWRVLQNYGIRYVLTFTTLLHQTLRTRAMRSRIIFLDKEFIFLDFPQEEKEELKALIEKINANIVRWSIPIPVFFEELKPFPEPSLYNDFLKTSTQGVIPNIQQLFAPKEMVFSESNSIQISLGDKQAQVDQILKTYFSSMTLKALQEQVIANILQKNHTIALLPTGYGKSLCFQIPALMTEGVTLVVSPLISLIENQLAELLERNIPAIWARSKQDLKESEKKIIYMTPEAFTDAEMVEEIANCPISLFVVDEAHCIYQWGNTFRQAYRNLSVIQKICPQAPILALSATATPEIVEDICKNLKLEEPKIVRGSFFRKNLSICVEVRIDLKTQILKFLNRHIGEVGIIYCPTRDAVNALHELLTEEDIACEQYHAGMSDSDRKKILSQFLQGKTKIVIATVAFGMGINKENVRFICHTKMPSSLEQFYQEVGRAGRDNLPAESLLLFSSNDLIEALLCKTETEDPEVKKDLCVKANQVLLFCQSLECRQKQLVSYFTGIVTQQTCNNCDHCLGKTEVTDGTKIVQHILRAILLTNGTLSLTNLAFFLCGETKLQGLEYTHLPVFGALSSYSSSEILNLLRYLVQTNVFSLINPETITEDSYFVLNDTSKKILENKEKVFIRKLSPIQNRHSLES